MYICAWGRRVHVDSWGLLASLVSNVTFRVVRTKNCIDMRQLIMTKRIL